jgi:ribosomal protein S18 acetylase RimI-like enzyme
MIEGELAIRRYEPRDKNAVWRVHERTFRATLPRFLPAVDRDLWNVPNAYLGAGEFLVGEVDGRIVAVVGFRHKDERTVELKRLQVRPDAWRRGYGRRVVTALEERARDRGYERAVLRASEHLEAAQSLYRSEDYRETKRERHPAADTELVYFEKRCEWL